MLSTFGSIVACSLQDFESLGRNGQDDAGAGGSGDALGNAGGAGSAGAGSSSGAGGSSGSAAGGSSGGQGGAADSGVGGSAGTGVTATGGVGGSLGLDGGVAPENIVPDPSFENGSSDWVPWNRHTLERTTSGPHSGSWCLHASGRDEDWKGPAFNMTMYVTQGQTYDVALAARVSAPEDAIAMTIKLLCRDPDDTTTPSTFFTAAGPETITNVWGEFTGRFTAPICDAPLQLQDLKLILERTSVDVDIYVDDVRIVPAPP